MATMGDKSFESALTFCSVVERVLIFPSPANTAGIRWDVGIAALVPREFAFHARDMYMNMSEETLLSSLRLSDGNGGPDEISA